MVVRARLRQRIRGFFAERKVLEVETPLLVSAAAADPNVPVLAVTPHDRSSNCFLHTSPEHAMKRLLSGGFGDIYQLVPVFRDGEQGRQHNPEFTLLEWYRCGFDHHRLADETIDLLRCLLGELPEVTRIAYCDAFQRWAALNPMTSDSAELAAATASQGGDPGWPRGVQQDYLFGTVVAPQLTGLTVVFDYPAEQAALARLKPADPRLAERFEVFIDGVEIANGFHELADAAEQRQRFEAERKRYAASGRVVPPTDERLLAALEAGLPDCAGVAVGFDRIVMRVTGSDDIRSVMAFPHGEN